MNHRRLLAIVYSVILAAAASAPCRGQETAAPAKPSAEDSQPANPYRLDFALSEIEGDKKLNTRNYSMTAVSGMKNVIRMGKRVPIETGSVTDARLTQIQYLDIGTNLDCRVRELPRGILLVLSIDFSSIAPEQASNSTLPNDPVVAQLKTDINTIVDLGKPTMIAKIDDPSSKRTFEWEVTATRVH